ncbi:MAG TPA: hypothetical protein ENK18_10785 [Deltaproteobacteria bacterium]|nr:hypothetical protein [Deltaproteobacteria bacterium]
MLLRSSLSLMLLGCGGPAEPDGTGDSGDTSPVEGAPGPGAFAPDFDTSSDFFTLMAGPVDGGTVHGTVQIWYSTNLRGLIESGGAFTAPVGSVAIKVQDNGVEAITAMIKRPAGFDPDNSDWSYEQRAIDGALNNEGALPSCIGCHVGWASTDYLGGTELR